MTTILTDGNFLITDKRTSKNYRYKKVNHEIRTDHSVKITLPQGGASFMGRRIVASAGSGYADEIDRFSRIIRLSDTVDLQDVFNVVSNFNISGERKVPKVQPEDGICTLTLLCDDGTYFIVRLLNHVKGRKIYTNVEADHYENGDLYIGGSGALVYGHIRPFLNAENLSVKDIYLFCSHTDPHSSNSYSVYSREEDTLFTSIEPTPEDIQASVYRVEFAIDFYRPEIKPKALGQ